jgi:hypothetical protein
VFAGGQQENDVALQITVIDFVVRQNKLASRVGFDLEREVMKLRVVEPAAPSPRAGRGFVGGGGFGVVCVVMATSLNRKLTADR